MDYQSFKNAVIAQCQAMGIAEYELYYQVESSASLDTFCHEVSEFSASESGGVCFRCIVGGKMGYASTEALNEAEAAAIVCRAYENALVLESEEAVFLCEGGQAYEPLEQKEYPLPTTEEMAKFALELEQKIYDADDAVVDGSQAMVMTGTTETAIYNSKGLDLYYKNSYSGVVADAVVSDGTEKANAHEIKICDLNTVDKEEMASKAAENAKQKLGGSVPPTAVCPVIFDPSAMASLLGAFSSLFSSEAAQKGLSKLGDKEGELIASPTVTLVDDHFHPENPEPINFDAEGCPAHKKNVIENGKLNTLLYNLKTAAVAGKTTTGNASKDSYDASVGISPFTMYLAAGECTEEQLLQKAEGGVYIKSLGGIHAGANAISGDFSLQSSGFLIRDGKKADFVKSFTVAGNFYELLQKITALSDKVVLPSPFGMTTFGSPCVLVENLTVAGK